MQEFTRRVVALIQGIPPGMVTSYGRIAGSAGNPRGARQVVRILSSLSEREKLPWHRVVNRDGRISLPAGGGHELQKALLQREGVSFDEQDRIDLSRHLWLPPEDWILTPGSE